MKKFKNNIELIDHFCLTDDLTTYDPYDIWKENPGLKIKEIYYRNKSAGFIPAGIFYLGDILFNSDLRCLYTPQEYPIVRALAGLTLIRCYKQTGNKQYLTFAEIHLDWLVQHYCKGYSGYCWGHNFKWASKNGIYDEHIPYITVTPYALEAFIEYRKITLNKKFDKIINSIFLFLEKDLIIQIKDSKFLALSYAPVIEPRIVINANSYALFSYSLLLDFLPQQKDYILNKIKKLYNFIVNNQNKNGSWFYYADNEPGNFIDCFHTCFILKNLIKLSKKWSDFTIDYSVIQNGASYLRNNFYDKKTGLYKRFSIADAPSFIKFDLYDNAEILNLFFLLNDNDNYNRLKKNIGKYFLHGKNIFSKIDCLNRKTSKNNLRWAVMPYLYSLSLSS